jgi:RimJ/RimL family protein N-acetyltransferase
MADRFTDRLRLVPIGPQHVDDLLLIFQDPVVAEWGLSIWTPIKVAEFAQAYHLAWHQAGVGKWIAYERTSGALVGRGGLSQLAADSPLGSQLGPLAGSRWSEQRLEVGWHLLSAYRGKGYATEIGREALSFAFDELDAPSVVAFTERHNVASRAVMERLEMRFLGQVLGQGRVEGSDEVRSDVPFAVYLSERPTA